MSNKTLLIIIGGSEMGRKYMQYKWRIKERFPCRQVKPYVLEFAYELSKEEIAHINEVLKKGVKYEIFTISEIVKQKLKE